jgi:hypothetical protein
MEIHDNATDYTSWTHLVIMNTATQVELSGVRELSAISLWIPVGVDAHELRWFDANLGLARAEADLAAFRVHNLTRPSGCERDLCEMFGRRLRACFRIEEVLQAKEFGTSLHSMVMP